MKSFCVTGTVVLAVALLAAYCPAATSSHPAVATLLQAGVGAGGGVMTGQSSSGYQVGVPQTGTGVGTGVGTGTIGTGVPGLGTQPVTPGATGQGTSPLYTGPNPYGGQPGANPYGTQVPGAYGNVYGTYSTQPSGMAPLVQPGTQPAIPYGQPSGMQPGLGTGTQPTIPYGQPSGMQPGAGTQQVPSGIQIGPSLPGTAPISNP